MTKIGVISDTHQRGPDQELCDLAERQFAGASLILHAGDLVHISVLDAFHGMEVAAVCGNMCEPSSSRVLPVKRVVEVEGVRIGLIHGWGSREGLENRIFPEFDDVDAIVYGHTHTPANHLRDGVLMFNPGAWSSWSMGRKAGTVGLLTVDGGEITGEIIPV